MDKDLITVLADMENQLTNLIKKEESVQEQTELEEILSKVSDYKYRKDHGLVVQFKTEEKQLE